MSLLEGRTYPFDYFIITHEHAMALRNGNLVDTEQKGFDNRRIEYIWLVEPKGSEAERLRRIK